MIISDIFKRLIQSKKVPGKKSSLLLKVVSFCVPLITGVLCSNYLIFKFSWSEVAQIFFRINYPLLIAASMAPIGLWMTRSLRWYILLKNSGEQVALGKIYLCNSAVQAVSMVTPASSGELFKVIMLKKAGLESGVTGLGTFAIERAIDFSTVAILGLSSLFFLDNAELLSGCAAGNMPLLFAAVILLMTIVMGLLIKARSIISLQKMYSFVRRTGGSLPKVVFIVVLSFLSWGIMLSGWYFSLLSINVDVGIVNTFFLMLVVSIAGIISLIPASLGVAEIGVTLVLMSMGQSEPLAQAGAIVIRLYGTIALALGMLHFIIWKIDDSFKHKKRSAAV